MRWLTSKRKNKFTYLFIELRKLHAVFFWMADILPISKLFCYYGPDWLTPGPQKSGFLVFWTHTTFFIFIWVLRPFTFIKKFYMLGPFIFIKFSTFQLFLRPFLICHIKVYIPRLNFIKHSNFKHQQGNISCRKSSMPFMHLMYKHPNVCWLMSSPKFLLYHSLIKPS